MSEDTHIRGIDVAIRSRVQPSDALLGDTVVVKGLDDVEQQPGTLRRYLGRLQLTHRVASESIFIFMVMLFSGLVIIAERDRLMSPHGKLGRVSRKANYTHSHVLQTPDNDVPFGYSSIHLQENISVCPSTVWVDMTHVYWAFMRVGTVSHMDADSLKAFVKPLSPIVGTRGNYTTVDGIVHMRFAQKRMHRIEEFQSNTDTLLLPSWCRFSPFSNSRCIWEEYTTVFWNQETTCLWPMRPKNVQLVDTNMWTNTFTRNVTRAARVMVAGGFFNNFWHAAIMLNTWCNVRHQEDIMFLVQDDEIPPFVLSFAEALGIHPSRVIHHTGPVLAGSVLLSPYHNNVDWSCLHGALSRKSTPNTIVVYFRPWHDPERNIPLDIHHRLVSRLSRDFPDLQVQTFYGNETLEESRRIFERAMLVIGPHGAGMVNLIFCKEATPVIELTTQDLLDRPWQAMGAQTFTLIWWPVLLRHFNSDDDILSVSNLARKALFYNRLSI